MISENIVLFNVGRMVKYSSFIKLYVIGRDIASSKYSPAPLSFDPRLYNVCKKTSVPYQMPKSRSSAGLYYFR